MFNHLDIPTLVPIAFCIFLISIGWVRINNRLSKIEEKRCRIETFLSNLKLFVESAGADQNAYLQMVHQSILVQRDIGQYGISSYKPAGSFSYINGYQIIINSLAELQRNLRNDDLYLIIKPGRDIAISIQDALVRYLGVGDELDQILRSMKRNPFTLLREGIAWLLSLPISIFSFIGVAGDDSAEKFSQNRITRIMSGIITIVGLFGTIVTLTTGWSQFRNIIMSTLGWQ